MRLLARSSGVALYEDGGRILVIDLKTRHAYTLGFVLGLITLIMGVNGIAFVVIAITGGGMPLALGLVLVAAAFACGFGLRAVIRGVKRRYEATPEPSTATVVFDLGRGQLCDGSGVDMAPLSSIKVARKMQLGSSSPALVVFWDQPTLVLARGNPFAGGIGPLERELRRHEIMR